MAQSAFRDMLRTRKDQSVAFIGRSGSGKSTNAKHCLAALLGTSNCANKCLTVDKMNAIHTLLEAFGHSRTIMNSNATRYVVLVVHIFEENSSVIGFTPKVFYHHFSVINCKHIFLFKAQR